MTILAISWDDAMGVDGRGGIRLLDQTLLPGTTEHREITTTDELVRAIAAPSYTPGRRDLAGVVALLSAGRQPWE